MRSAWLVPLLLLCLPYACSDDEGDDGNTGGSAGSGTGGSAGSGAGGAAGSGGGAGTAGSGAAGAGGSAGASAGGSAGGGGAGGSGGGSSGSDDCVALCARSIVCPGCLAECEDSVELCPTQSAALFACIESLPDSDFQCLGELIVPDDDVCVSQTAPFERCRIGF